jgi:uncharacterized protein (UPF0179 family)
MKVGEIYYCIKDRISNNNIINKAGKKYEILQIREKYNRVKIKSEKNDTYHYHYNYFYCITNDNKSWIFSEHFVSLQEYRKLKIEKLNNL